MEPMTNDDKNRRIAGFLEPKPDYTPDRSSHSKLRAWVYVWGLPYPGDGGWKPRDFAKDPEMVLALMGRMDFWQLETTVDVHGEKKYLATFYTKSKFHKGGWSRELGEAIRDAFIMANGLDIEIDTTKSSGSKRLTPEGGKI